MKWLVILIFLINSAHAQSPPVLQSGNVTPGHPTYWVTDGVVGDGGTAVNGFLTELGVMKSGPGICQNSGPTSGAYNQICISVTGSTAAITFNSFAGATGNFALPNGVTCSGTPSSSFASVNGVVTHC